jgi:hypothetical protein
LVAFRGCKQWQRAPKEHKTLLCAEHKTLLCEEHSTLLCRERSALLCEEGRAKSNESMLHKRSRHVTLACAGQQTLPAPARPVVDQLPKRFAESA